MKSGIFHRTNTVTLAILLSATSTWQTFAAETALVSRAEHEELKSQLTRLQQRIKTLESEKNSGISTSDSHLDSSLSKSAKEAIAALQADYATLKAESEDQKGGSTNFVLTGNAEASFSALNNTSSSFGASFSPIILWTINDQLFFESEIEMELADSETEVKLEYAQLSYFLNDSVTIGVGKFLAPSNVFVERYEGKWINKLPDTPLAIYDGILPESIVGLQIRGGVPIENTKLLYAAYVGNGPKLDVKTGALNFDNFTDTKDAKAFGGRIGFIPLRGLEVGYAFQHSKVGDAGTDYSDISNTIHSIDFDFTKSSPMLKGVFDLRGQYAWSKTDNTSYVGINDFNNNSNGGYVQASYRPSLCDSDFLRKMELVFRYDRLKLPSGAPETENEHRSTFGLDYWIASSTVFKVAYELDSKHSEADNSGVIFQVATGF